MKKISIIIATYNAGKVLLRCLDSIRPQKTDEIELLIIDGNSKDNTMELVNANSDIIDFHVSEPDMGIYDAWNKGIKAATGEWILFLGADDQLMPNAISVYLEYLSIDLTDNIDIISAKAKMVDSKGNVVCVFGKQFIWDEFRKNMLFSHGTTLHASKFLKENGAFDLDYKICADYEYFMRNGNKIKSQFIDKVLIVFQVGGASATFAGQIETFRIRKKYNSVSILLNIMLTFRRMCGIIYRNVIKNLQ